MNPKLLILVAAVLVFSDLYSQSSKFSYWTETCTCIGEFDSTLISRAQLQNTFDYLWWAPDVKPNVPAWTFKQIELLKVDTLKKNCFQILSRLNNLEFVNDTFWVKVKEERVKFYEASCLLKEYTILAYNNPDTLNSYYLVDSISDYYRQALINGEQSMIDAWISLNEFNKSQNSIPEKLQEKFDKKFNSANKFEFARLELMLFGWGNSANHLLPHINTSYHYSKEFEKLLSNVKCECDEF